MILVRPVHVALLLLGTATLAAIHSVQIPFWASPDPTAVSAEFRQCLVIVGVFNAGIAAWCAGLIAMPSTAFCPVGAKRRGYPVATMQFGQLCVASLSGLLLGMAPSTVWTLLHASSNGFSPLVALGGLLGLCAFLAAGYLVGLLLPSLVSVPVAVALAFCWVVMTGVNGTPASPVWPFEVIAGFHETTTTALVRAGYFASGAALCMGAAGWWLRERRVRATLLPFIGLVSFLVPLSVTTGMLARSDMPLLEPDAGSANPACQSTEDGVLVCVHPARRNLLPTLTVRVEQVTQVLGKRASGLTEVSDATLWLPSSPGRLSLQIQYKDAQNWDSTAAGDVALAIAGLANCYGSQEGAMSTGTSTSTAVAAWILQQAGIDPAGLIMDPEARSTAVALDSFTASTARARILTNIKAIQECQGTPKLID